MIYSEDLIGHKYTQIFIELDDKLVEQSGCKDCKDL